LSILWHYTGTRHAARALKELEHTFVDWNEVRVSPVVEVAAAISHADWAWECAQQMIQALQNIFDARNVVSLECLGELTTAQARTFLQSLPGVGRELADEVLLFSLQAEVLPVGEDAARMCYRLGLIRTDRPTLEHQKELRALWPPEMYAPVTLFFVDHARSVCRPDKARCGECPLRAECPKEEL